MTPTADPRVILRRQLAVAAAGVLIVVAVAWIWALRPLAPEPFAMPADKPAEQVKPSLPLTPEHWNAALWRPWSDAPAAVAMPPSTLRLLSIVRHGEAYVATVQVDQGLAHVRVGDAVGGGTVAGIDATGVDLRMGEETRRLEFAR